MERERRKGGRKEGQRKEKRERREGEGREKKKRRTSVSDMQHTNTKGEGAERGTAMQTFTGERERAERYTERHREVDRAQGIHTRTEGEEEKNKDRQ